MKKRILSIILSIVMLVSLLPTAVLAVDSNPHTGGHDGWTVWDGTHIDVSGNYYLNSTVNSSTNTYILIGSSTEAINVTLCLNGNSLNLGCYLTIMNATVNLCDCSSGQTGKIVGNNTYNYTIFQDGNFQTTLNMYGGEISGKSQYGAVFVDGSSHTFNMYGGNITNNYTGTYRAGAVCVAVGEFNMNGGSISGYTGEKCSGIYAYGGATVTMEDGAVIENNASASAVYLSNNSSTFTMNGGSISVNGTNNDSNVYGIDNSGTVNIYGGTVSTGSTGNAIYSINNKGTVNVCGGTVISGKCGINNDKGIVNVSNSGTVSGDSYGIDNTRGTVFVSGGTVSGTGDASLGIENYGDTYGTGSVTVTGGTVSGGPGTGGNGNSYGISNSGNGSELTVSGGSINAADNTACGIFHYGAFLNLSGNPTINGSSEDIRLTSDMVITIGEDGLSNASPYTVATNKDPTESAPVPITSGTETVDYSGKFVSADSNYMVKSVQTGNTYQVVLVEKPENYTVTFDANGGSGIMETQVVTQNAYTLPECTFTAPVDKIFYGWATSADGEVIKNKTYTLMEDTTFYPVWGEITEVKYTTDDGESWNFDSLMNAIWKYSADVEIKLLKDITLTSSEWSYAPVFANTNANVTIDGQDHTITRCNGVGTFATIGEEGSTVTLKNITIDGGAVWLGDNPATRTNSGYSTDGYYLFDVDNGTLILDDGVVIQNAHLTNSNSYGGAVAVSQTGKLIMNDGAEIKNCTAGSGGGVCIVSSTASFTMNGGKITGCYATSGGGAVLAQGTFTMNGGEISNNASDNNGGAVTVSTDGVFTLVDGAVKNNSSVVGGGAITILAANAILNLKGGEIFGNKITGNLGGGILVNNGTFNLSGNPVIKDNLSGTKVNNVYLGTSKLINIVDVLSNTTKIGITMGNASVFTSGWNDYMSTAEISDCFVSEDDNYIIAKNEESGELMLAAKPENTVTFNANGGTGIMAEQTITGGEATALSENTFTRTGYTFAGWNTNADGTGTDYADKASVTDIASAGGSITLYAQWSKIPATAPTITSPPQGFEDANALTYGSIDAEKKLSVETDANESEYTVTYQWYKNTQNFKDGATAVSDGTSKDLVIESGLNAGDYYYYCKITVTRIDNSETATVDTDLVKVTVNKATPVIDDFTAVTSSDITYDGAEKPVTVNTQSGTVGMGTVTIKYYKNGDPVDGVPKDAGEYTFKINVSEGDNYSAVSDLTKDIWKFEIKPRKVELAWGTTSFVYDGTEKTVTASVSNKVGSDVVNLTIADNKATNVDDYIATVANVDNSNYTLEGVTATKPWYIVQSGTSFTETKVLKDGTETNDFTYGETITIRVKPVATGMAPATFSLYSLSAPTENQMALYLGGTQISDSTTADIDGYYTMTVDTTENTLPVGGIVTLTAKYVGNDNMANYEENVTITLTKASQSAPTTPVAVTETIKGKADGKITGVDSTMEYKKQTDASYTGITGEAVENLATGTYLVRYKEDSNHFASEDTQVVIAEGAMITVTFNSNEGTEVESKTCEYNQTIAAPDEPTKEGFEFISWYLEDTFTTKWTNEYLFTADTTLYAKWVQGTVSDHEDHVGEVEADGLNDVAKTEEINIKLVVQIEETLEGDTEQTAIKALENTPNNFGFYEITLEKSTGGNVTSASSVIEIKLPYDFTRKTNIKVYRHHEGSAEELAQLDARATAPYVDGNCYVDKENNCIYIYSFKFSTYAVAYDTVRSSSGGGTTRYTVKFDTDGGSTVSNTTVTRNTKVTEPKAPEKEGYTFMGWFTDEALTKAYDFDTKVTKSITLYAKWEKVDDDEPEAPNNTGSHNCPSKEFDDLDVNAWYHLDTDYVIENGIFKGVTEKEFAPNANLTRAMLVTVLYRVEGEPEMKNAQWFEDVAKGQWYSDAVAWATFNGITMGYGDGNFGPDDYITREQIAAIMHRYAQYKGYDVSVGENTNILSYDDFDNISEYAVAAMQYAVGSGLMKGKTTSTLNPLDNATRAEIAAILHMFIETNK